MKPKAAATRERGAGSGERGAGSGERGAISDTLSILFWVFSVPS